MYQKQLGLEFGGETEVTKYKHTHIQTINLHSYATEQNAAVCNFLDGKDPPSKPFHHTCVFGIITPRNCLAMGLELKKKGGEGCYTVQEENALWEKE